MGQDNFGAGGETGVEGYPQEQQQFQPVPYGALPPRLSIDDKWQYQLDDVLERAENFLRSRVKDPETGGYKKTGEPLMENEGVNLLIGDLSARLHKGVSLSNLSKEDVNRMMLQFNEMLIDWIYLKAYEFKIDKSNYKRILVTMDNMIFTLLMQAYNDLSRKHRSQITSINESRVFTDNAPKKRFGIF